MPAKKTRRPGAASGPLDAPGGALAGLQSLLQAQAAEDAAAQRAELAAELGGSGQLAGLEAAEDVFDGGADTVAFEPEEHYPGVPTGRARRPDLVSRARAKVEDEAEVLLHAEIELRYRGDKRPGLLSYHRGLSLKYALPVHTIVLYLHGGPPGAQPQVYPERSLGRVVGTVGYYSLGLSRMPAAEYLARPEPLAWAFAVLMCPARGQSRPELGTACLQRIETAPALSRTEKELLVKCVWTYARFKDHPALEFDMIMAELKDKGVREMTTTMVEWWKKEGLKAGRKEGMEAGMRQGEASLLRRLLRRRFEDLPEWIDQRLEQASQRDLETWADRVLDAKRLEDVFSPA